MPRFHTSPDLNEPSLKGRLALLPSPIDPTGLHISRMFVIDRTRTGSDDVPQEVIDMAGSTGNVYQINIGLVPSCTCPDHNKGNQCKHIIYVNTYSLKSSLVWLSLMCHFKQGPSQCAQSTRTSRISISFPLVRKYDRVSLRVDIFRSLTSSFPTLQELREIFSQAPLPLSSERSASSQDSNSANQTNNRKEISGDCPICFTEFEPSSDEIVWCKAACGNNIHRTCFEQWAKSQKSRQQVCCVFW